MKHFISFIGFVFVLSFGITPTVDGAERGVPLSRTPTQAAPAQSAESVDAAVLESTCTSCHEIGGWEHLAENSEQDWRDLIARMISNGASVTEAETDTIALYLTATAALTIEPADTLVAESTVPEGEGLLNAQCTVCHEVGGWDHLATYSEQDWRDLLARMISYGATVTEAETDTIALYLTATAALTIEPADTLVAESAVPEAEGLLNAQCTVCHEVGGWDHLAAYSEQDWRDLLARMISYGATVTEAETDTIALYLTATAALTIEPADTLVAESAVPEAEGLLNAQCTVCHEVGGWDHLAAYSEQDWRDLLARMISYGATVTEDEVDILAGHLTATAGLTIEPSDAGGVGGGAALLQTACTVCHEVAGFEDLGFTAEAWRETIDRMLSYGASVSDTDIETLIRYLTGGAADEAEDTAVGP